MAENGVWRTISGRRVFIKDGQSLSDAMRESGKFGGDGKDKTSNKKTSEKNKTKEEELAELEKKLKETKGLKPIIAIRDEINRVKQGFTKEEWENGEKQKFKDSRASEREARAKRIADMTKQAEMAEIERIANLKEVKPSDILKSPDDIKKILKENDFKQTKNINEAIYMFEDGSMMDGEFSGGNRGIDHNSLRSLVDDKTFMRIEGADDFVSLHVQTNAIRLVPETKTALIMKNQNLTSSQKSKIKKSGFEIMEYTINPDVIKINGNN